MSKKFDKLLERATEPSLLEADWELIMSCIDAVRSGEVPAKNALGAVRKRFHSENPHVAHHALMVLEALVKNCGEKVHKEIATKDFMEDMKHLANDSGDKVKDKILELIQCWSHAFRDKAEYKIVNDTHNLMKLEGFSFPPLRESDAMFDAEAAPEWVDSNKCYRCRTEFGLFTRKHHCRNCGQIFCDKCSSKYVPLPHIGIEVEVRVCETCYDTIRNKLATKVAPKTTNSSETTTETSSTPKSSNSKSGGKSEDEIREEEELQLALAISQSEADEKERMKQRNLIQKYGGYSGTTSESPKHKDPVVNGSSSFTSGYTGTVDRNSDANDSDGELAKYLNRSYWESRRSDQKKGILRNSPTPSAPIAPTEVDHAAETSSDGKLTDSNNTSAEKELNGMGPDFSEFVDNLRTRIEVFVNRIRNDQARGRSVISDSGIQSMFVDLTSLHTQLIKNMAELDDRRGYFESLQDRLAQIKDAREAVDALREEHEQRRQAELMELQRQRQIQMAAKLDVMRHKKHEMLEQQRLMVMQKMEEQRREMEIRRQMQLQQQQSSMVGVYGGPGAGVAYNNAPMQQHPHMSSYVGQQQSYDSYNVQQMNANLPNVQPSQQQQQQQQQQQMYASTVPVATVQPQLPQNPVAEQQTSQQYAAVGQHYQPTQTPYYNQPVVTMGAAPHPYGSMAYSTPHQHLVATAVVPPLQQPQQHQHNPNVVYQQYANAMPAAVPPGSMIPGTMPAQPVMGSPMHYVHQSYVGPQMTSMPQSHPQYGVAPQTHVVYSDPQQMAMQNQPPPHQPVEAQLISFD